MKILSIITSILTVFYIATSIFTQQIIEERENGEFQEVTLVEVSGKTNQLEIEKVWAPKPVNKPKNKPKIAKKTEKKEATQDAIYSPVLTIAGVKYQLLGIFSNQENPFIILQDPNKKMLKVVQGQEISSGNMLDKVYADRVAVKTGNKVTEFKLFELKKNA